MFLEMNHGLLIKPRNANLDNIELRVTLEKAVEDADLNVTERAALNHKFFPHGDGFKLFPLDKDTAEFSIYKKDDDDKFDDPFSRELKEIKCPEHVTTIDAQTCYSKQGNYLQNLNNALKKLYDVLK